MNFFTHARRFLHDPYFVAGTAVPDWLGVLDRRVRARSSAAETLLDDPDPRVVSIAQGIIQHHFDDGWFHQTESFYRLTGRLARKVREQFPFDSSMRAGFVGHVIVELLLDDVLIQVNPTILDYYYDLFERIDPALVESTVTRISRYPADRLSQLIPRFVTERFLYDYKTDERLLWRMNHVLKRVGLEPLSVTDTTWLVEARELVAMNVNGLLEGEEAELAAVVLRRSTSRSVHQGDS